MTFRGNPCTLSTTLFGGWDGSPTLIECTFDASEAPSSNTVVVTVTETEESMAWDLGLSLPDADSASQPPHILGVQCEGGCLDAAEGTQRITIEVRGCRRLTATNGPPRAYGSLTAAKLGALLWDCARPRTSGARAMGHSSHATALPRVRALRRVVAAALQRSTAGAARRGRDSGSPGTCS